MADKPTFQQLQFPELIDIETLARLLGVGERYLRRMVAERRDPTVKVGHYVRSDLLDIRKWIDEHAARTRREVVPARGAQPATRRT